MSAKGRPGEVNARTSASAIAVPLFFLSADSTITRTSIESSLRESSAALSFDRSSVSIAAPNFSLGTASVDAL